MNPESFLGLTIIIFIVAWVGATWRRDTRLGELCDQALSVLTLIAFVLVWHAWLTQREQSTHITDLKTELKEERACEKSPICMDGRARWQSILEKDSPQESRTGRIFFRGKLCDGDCSEVIKGYKWAEQLGVKKRQACGGSSLEFMTGCLLYVEPHDEYNDEKYYGHEPDYDY